MCDSAEVDSKLREAALMKKRNNGANNASTSSNNSNSDERRTVGSEEESGDEKASISGSEPKLLLHPQLPKEPLPQQQDDELTPSISTAMNEMDMKYEQED